jgi:hypothetical protein
MMRNVETAKEILDFIKEIEINLKPQYWKFNEIDIWPILRVSLYYELSMSSNGFQLKKPSLNQKIRRVASIIPPILFPKKVGNSLLLVSDGISYIKINESLYERFCDPLLETALKLNKNLLWSKWDLLTTPKGKFVFNSLKISSVIDYILIKSTVRNIDIKLKDKENILAFCKLVNTVSLGKLNWSLKSIEKKLQNIDAMASFYIKQLTLLKPKLVLIVSFYSDRAMALIYACNKLEITTADIQHGVQGELHVAYSSWQNIPVDGYNTIPNHFLVWSGDEKSSIDKWAIYNKKHSAEIIENLFQEKWFSNSDVLINQFDIDVEKIVNKMKAKHNILFTLQYGTQYNDWIFELIAHTQQQFNWLIRLHPLLKDQQSLKYFKDKLKQFRITNFELTKSTELPLYCLLRNVNLHITHSSSTVIEALNFQIKTILLSNYGSELFESQINEDMAYLVTDSSDNSVRFMVEKVNQRFKNRIIDDANYSKSSQLVSDYLKKYL